MGSALGLTQGSDPSFGLGWNSHREGLEGGDSLLFPRTLLTQREGVRQLMFVKVLKAKLFFPLKQHNCVLPNNMAPLPGLLSSQL